MKAESDFTLPKRFAQEVADVLIPDGGKKTQSLRDREIGGRVFRQQQSPRQARCAHFTSRRTCERESKLSIMPTNYWVTGEVERVPIINSSTIFYHSSIPSHHQCPS